MTKEIYISSTPHETRLAVVEDDLLAEIYYERENEYTLAGSIYKGKVTRVLPGMQSAFVDIGLERDAFLYVTDFAEEQEDGEEYVSLAPGTRGQARLPNGGRGASASESQAPSEDSASRSFNERRPAGNQPAREGSGAAANASGEEDGQGGRRWRGRRGRRRGRGGLQNRPAPTSHPEPVGTGEAEPMEFETGAVPHEPEASFESAYPEETSQSLPETRIRAVEQHRPPSTPGHPETLMLPGESLSKYRRGDAPAPSATPQHSETAAPAPKPTFQPSTIVTGPMVAWDGSGVLSGEPPSRHKRSRETAHAESFSSPAAEV